MDTPVIYKEALSEAEANRRTAILEAEAPMVLPPRVTLKPLSAAENRYVFHGISGVSEYSVILGVEVHDGEDWLHLSVCHQSRYGMRVPGWEALGAMKSLFLGDRQAIQVFAPAAEHYSVAEVLHLWAKVDGSRIVPDFRVGGML